jgi:hypothetical protein
LKEKKTTRISAYYADGCTFKQGNLDEKGWRQKFIRFVLEKSEWRPFGDLGVNVRMILKFDRSEMFVGRGY